MSQRIKHGACKGGIYSPEYQYWFKIKQVCHNKRHSSYKYYGALGIVVDPIWRVSFSTFLQDVGLQPSPNYTLERKDQTKPFQKDNCYWVTKEEARKIRQEQRKNKNQEDTV